MNSRFCRKTQDRCFCWFPAAICAPQIYQLKNRAKNSHRGLYTASRSWYPSIHHIRSNEEYQSLFFRFWVTRFILVQSTYRIVPKIRNVVELNNPRPDRISNCEAETTKESIKTKTESGNCFCILVV